MEPEGFAPTRAQVAPLLRTPSNLPPQKGDEDELAVEQHADGCQKCGEQDFDKQARKKAKSSAESFGLPLLEEDDQSTEKPVYDGY